MGGTRRSSRAEVGLLGPTPRSDEGKRLHLADATVATEPKLPNGVVDRMVPVHSAMPAVCTTLN